MISKKDDSKDLLFHHLEITTTKRLNVYNFRICLVYTLRHILIRTGSNSEYSFITSLFVMTISL